ncbi:hypothetical protein J5X84_41440 [Streptosporangiaceae bacterium NEAU-GS5]|nr:hypothetical protein [Streptosporangiaceae bacterium NEAU-GS5]
MTAHREIHDDELLGAVMAAERHAAQEQWDGSRRIYALTDRRTYEEVTLPLDPIEGVPEGGLVAVPLTPVGPGDLRDELAKMTWPTTVLGCILVIEIEVGPPEGQNACGVH